LSIEKNIFNLQSVITNQKEISSGYFRLSFLAPKIAQVAQAGQFLHIYCGGDTYLRRPFSIAGVKKNQVEIIYKIIGKGTELLSQKKKGETLDLIGPLGTGFSLSPITYHLSPVLVAGGTGVASLLFLTHKLVPHPLSLVTVLVGAKTKNNLLCVSDFKKLGCKVKLATEDGSLGFKGLVSDLFTSFLVPRPPFPVPAVFACGPYPMLKEIAKICGRKQIKCQVSLENIMACGLGACRGCVVKTRMTADEKKSQISADKFKYKTVCKDGPVFEAKEIIWE